MRAPAISATYERPKKSTWACVLDLAMYVRSSYITSHEQRSRNRGHFRRRPLRHLRGREGSQGSVEHPGFLPARRTGPVPTVLRRRQRRPGAAMSRKPNSRLHRSECPGEDSCTCGGSWPRPAVMEGHEVDMVVHRLRMLKPEDAATVLCREFGAKNVSHALAMAVIKVQRGDEV